MNEEKNTNQEPITDTLIQPDNEPNLNLEELQAKTQELETALNEQKDLTLRAKAETENIRRRAAEDVQNAYKFAINKFVTELLPVKDSLEMALSDQSGQFDALKQGVELTLKQLNIAFERGHVTEIDPLGEKLDPHRHQAMSTEVADAENNTVTQVMQKGYAIADRVVRPALVVVSKSD